MEFEDALWAQLEAAAEREQRRRTVVARAAAATRAGVSMHRVTAAASAVLVVAAAFAMIAALRPQADRQRWRVEHFTRVAGDLRSGVTGFGSLWTYDVGSGEILRVDSGTHRVVARIPFTTGQPDVALATAAGAVWAVPAQPITHTPVPAHPSASVLTRIDPHSNRVTARVTLRAPDGATLTASGIIAGRRALWVWGAAGAQRVDPAEGRVSAVVKVPNDQLKGVTATDTRLYVVTELGRLVTFDARTGARLASILVPAPTYEETLVAAGDAIVIDRQDGAIASIDPMSGRTHWSARLGRQPEDLAIAGGRLWVLLTGDAHHDLLLALDPATGRTTIRLVLPTSRARGLAGARAAPLITTTGGGVLIPTPPG